MICGRRGLGGAGPGRGGLRLGLVVGAARRMNCVAGFPLSWLLEHTDFEQPDAANGTCISPVSDEGQRQQVTNVS